MDKYLLAIDQGTTGTTSLIFNINDFSLKGKVNFEFPQIYPSPGLVEHNLEDIWSSVKKSILAIFKQTNIRPDEISGIGITNQRETTCAFTKKGIPLENAIVWQDKRTIDFCNELKKDGKEELVKNTTGLPIDPYFSATKMWWFLNKCENVKKAAQNDDLLLGTIDTFLLYRLTNNSVFKTESTNASRTLLMDLKSGNWDSELLSLFQIKEKFLPKISDSFGDFGTTKGLDFLPDGVPISCILGDQQSALFGQGGIRSGGLKCTYGTGSFALLNTGTEIKRSSNGLLTTVAYQNNKEKIYALEGSCYIAGAAVQWLRDNLNIIKDSPEVEQLARKVTNLEEMKYLLFYPFFSGLGSPYWKPEGLGAIIGITRDTNKNHLAYACLDGIALSINDLLMAFKKDFSESINELSVDGGAVSNDLLMEIQASVSEIKINRPQILETTALGAAFGAGIALGFLKFEDISNYLKVDRTFSPNPSWQDHYSNKKLSWETFIKKIFLL